uniref:F-box only protein 47-like n=1 Tax=Saccoglossus kowalevskii TaxID=10224 RepID=A0ABM0M6M1_SACKO|nr:PREDICTED: F-box only protein 47-like [Saccoglossus kowalevskii]
MGYVKRKGTKDARKLPGNFDEFKESFLECITNAVSQEAIPSELVINFDQTGLHIVPVSSWTLAKDGERQVPIICLKDEREITAVFAVREIKTVYSILDCISNSGCQNLSSCVSLNCYGQFIHTIIAGWDPLECHRAFSTIASCSNILTTMGACISAKPGAKSHDEIYIRIFLHRVLLDWSDGDDKTFWLSRILKPWPMVQQARILYILYGPKCPHSDAILWYEMTDSTPGSSATSLTTQLAELALALKMLYNCKEWSEDDIISVIEELTALPDEWVTENVSKLLMLCGDTICIKVMGSKVINGHYQELSQLIVSLSVVTTKEQYSMSWVIKLVRRLLGITESLKEQKILLATIAETFKEIIFDIYEYNDEETDLSFQYVLDAQAEFNKEVMSLAFLEKEQN